MRLQGISFSGLGAGQPSSLSSFRSYNQGSANASGDVFSKSDGETRFGYGQCHKPKDVVKGSRVKDWRRAKKRGEIPETMTFEEYNAKKENHPLRKNRKIKQ